jgi:hypothetical protein
MVSLVEYQATSGSVCVVDAHSPLSRLVTRPAVRVEPSCSQAVDPHLWLRSLRVVIEAPAEIWLG